MTRNFIVSLNSSLIEPHRALFYSFYAAEAVLTVLTLLAQPLLSLAICRHRLLHLNIRIFFITWLVQSELCIIARIVLFVYQFTDRPLNENDPLLLFSNIARDTNFGYYCLMLPCLVVDRTFAVARDRDRLMAGYARESIAAAFVIVLPLFIAETVSIAIAASWTFDYISTTTQYIVFFCSYAVGASLLLAVFVSNVRTLRVLLREGPGSARDEYTLARRFVVRENLRVCRICIILWIPVAALSSISFFFFGLFIFLPSHMYFRFIAIGIFDVWVSLVLFVVVVLCIWREAGWRAQLYRIPPVSWLLRVVGWSADLTRTMNEVGSRDDTSLYFARYAEQWRAGPAGRSKDTSNVLRQLYTDSIK